MFGTYIQATIQMDDDVKVMDSTTAEEATSEENAATETANFDEDEFDREPQLRKNKKILILLGVVGVVFLLGCGAIAVAFLVDWEGGVGASSRSNYQLPRTMKLKEGGGVGAAIQPEVKGAPPAYKIHKLDDASCEDFHEFACRTLPALDSNEIVSDNRDVTFSPMRTFLETYRSLLEDAPSMNEIPSTKMIREMLRTCTDKENVEAKGTVPLKAVVKQLGGWPLMEGVIWSGNRDMVMTLMGNISRFWGSNGLIDVHVGHNAGSRTPVIQISPANVDRITTYYPRRPPVPILDSDDYIFSIVYVAHALSQRPDNFAAVKMAAQNLAKLEADLKNLMSPEKLHDVVEMNIRDLSDYTKVNWLPFFEAVFQDIKHIKGDEKIAVSDKQRLRNIFRLLSDLPDTETSLANFIFWQFIQDLIWHTNQEMQTLSDKLRGVPAENIPATFRAMRCVDYAVLLLPYAVTRHYVDTFINEKDLKAIEEVAGNIKTQFSSLVNKGSWLSAPSRRALRKKLEEVRLKIGYPKWITNNELMQEFYGELKMGPNHLENILNAAEVKIKNELMQIKYRNDKFELWKYSPLRANAAFYFEENTIYICLGMIRSLSFAENTALPAKYGGLGAVIAHEFSHTYDETGMFFGTQAGPGLIFPDDMAPFDEKTQCLVKQYNNFCTRKCINGNATLSENFADNVGLSVAYQTFLKQWGGVKLESITKMRGFDEYSPEQLFFVNYASMHCVLDSPQVKEMFTNTNFHSPPEFRVNGPVSNMEEFATVFVCSVDGLMNRRDEERCRLW